MMYKYKETKSLITRESIKKELLFRNKITIPIIALCCIFSVIFVLIAISMVNDLSYELRSFGWSTSVVGGMAMILGSFLLCALMLFFAYTHITSIKDIKAYKFGVAEDRLSHSEEETVVTYRRGHRYVNLEKVFYFYKYGRYVVQSFDGSTFEYSSPEDEFYLVFESPKSKYPAMVYNKKVYEYKE